VPQENSSTPRKQRVAGCPDECLELKWWQENSKSDKDMNVTSTDTFSVQEESAIVTATDNLLQ